MDVPLAQPTSAREELYPSEQYQLLVQQEQATADAPAYPPMAGHPMYPPMPMIPPQMMMPNGTYPVMMQAPNGMWYPVAPHPNDL